MLSNLRKNQSHIDDNFCAAKKSNCMNMKVAFKSSIRKKKGISLRRKEVKLSTII
jgi:hypothetical protein